MKLLLAGVMLVSTACWGIDVGIWDNSRLYDPSLNVQTGSAVSVLRSQWEARGAVWHQTPTLTPAFLSTVTVFLTSMGNTVWATADEQTALVNWVKAGGTFAAIGDCS